MINRNLIRSLFPKIRFAIKELFDFCIQHQKNPNDFILFLENGHKVNEKFPGLSPYMIGQGHKGIADYARQDFFRVYLNIPFRRQFNNTKDRNRKKAVIKLSLHYELMIYSHCWEAYPNLRILKQLVNMANGDPYEWELSIPDFGKHEFIRKTIRDSFQKHTLKVASIITDGYHSQLRNAFAHSQYSFWLQDKIELHNYSGNSFEMKDIPYKDWAIRFHTTMLLFDVILKQIDAYKRALGLKSKMPGVWIPTSNGHKLKFLYYDVQWNRFIWKDNMK